MSRTLTALFVRLGGAARPHGDRVPDADLLVRVARTGDPAAFELLFWRHGPMVWGVCRRVLGHTADAEDAFQAVFLVLARKAGSVADGPALAGWLHRVAWRTALNARVARARRRAREAPADDPAGFPGPDDPAGRAAARELRDVLDRELARLPEKFRLPVLLCDVEGQTHEAAAAELGCPLGTLNSRLARGREKLRRRLLPLGLPAAGLAALAAPPEVAAAAVGTLSHAPAEPVQALATGVIRSMAVAAVGRFVAGGLLAAGLVFGVVAAADGPASPAEPPAAPPIVAADGDNPRRYLDPDAGPLPPGAVALVGSLRFRHADQVTGLAYSPDGKWLASVSTGVGDPTARLWDAATGKERLRVKVAINQCFAGYADGVPTALGFTADAKQFLVADTAELRSFDVDTGRQLSSHPILAQRQPGGDDNPDKSIQGSGISPDGRRFVAADLHGRVEIRETATGAVLAVGTHPFKNFICLDISFSPDGRRFLIHAGRHAAQVFDTGTGRAEALVEPDGRVVQSAVFGPSGATLDAVLWAKGGGGNVAIARIDARSGVILKETAGEGLLAFIKRSADGSLIATGRNDLLSTQVVDSNTGREIGQVKIAPVAQRVAFSPNNQFLACAGSISGAIRISDIRTGRTHSASPGPVIPWGIRFSADGRGLVMSDRGYPLVDWRTGAVVDRLADVWQEYPLQWSRVVVSPDRTLIAVPTGSPPAVRLLDARTGRLLRSWVTPKFNFALTFSGDGRRLAACGLDDVLRVWDTMTGREVTTVHKTGGGIAFSGVVFSRDGRVFAVHENSGSVRTIVSAWDTDTGRRITRIEAPDQFAGDVALSPDGRWLAGGGGYDPKAPPRQPELFHTVTVWEVATGQVRHSLPGHVTATVATACSPRAECSFSPDSRWLATGDAAGSLRVWEVLTGREVCRFVGHRSQVYTPNFSPDGRLLVAASLDAPCFVWDVAGTAGRLKPIPAADLDRLWDDLGGADAKAAFAAVRRLAADPGPATDLLRRHLAPARPVDRARVGTLIRDLDAAAFADREAAAAELAALADRIEPTLRAVLSATPSAEVRARLERALERAVKPSADRVRQSRALAVLEFVGTPGAAAVLDNLAGGDQDDPLTRAAAEGRVRLRERGVK